jgi:hypothetical protein
MKFENKEFVNEDISLDGNEFIKCAFKKCKIIYIGIKPVGLANSSFSDCSLIFEGPAANTVDFMMNMYSGGFRELIEATFNNIRKNIRREPLKFHSKEQFST